MPTTSRTPHGRSYLDRFVEQFRTDIGRRRLKDAKRDRQFESPFLRQRVSLLEDFAPKCFGQRPHAGFMLPKGTGERYWLAKMGDSVELSRSAKKAVDFSYSCDAMVPSIGHIEKWQSIRKVRECAFSLLVISMSAPIDTSKVVLFRAAHTRNLLDLDKSTMCRMCRLLSWSWHLHGNFAVHRDHRPGDYFGTSNFLRIARQSCCLLVGGKSLFGKGVG